MKMNKSKGLACLGIATGILCNNFTSVLGVNQKPQMLSAVDDQSNTLLHIAAEEKNVDLFNFLTAAGADLNLKNIFGKTVFDLFFEDKYPCVINFFLQHAQFKTSKSLKIIRDDEYGSIMNYILDNITDINVVDEYGETCLHKAAKYGNLEDVKLILKKNPNLQAKNKYNQTPILVAAINRHPEIVEFLLENVAEADKPAIDFILGKKIDEKNLNFRCEPVEGKDAGENFKFFINDYMYADTESTYEEYGETPLHLANQKGTRRLVEAILNLGKSTQVKDLYHKTVFHYAVIGENFDVVRLLLENGVDVNAKDLMGNTPFHDAIMYANVDMVKFLLENGADVNAQDMFGESGLHKAVYNSENLEIAQLLLDNGANLFTTNSTGETPLQMATELGYQEFVELFKNS